MPVWVQAAICGTWGFWLVFEILLTIRIYNHNRNPIRRRFDGEISRNTAAEIRLRLFVLATIFWFSWLFLGEAG